MTISLAYADEVSPLVRRAAIVRQDLRFQEAIRNELSVMAKERGLRLVPKAAKPRDIVRVMAEPAPVDADAPTGLGILPQAHWKLIVREVCEKHRISLVDLCSHRRLNSAVVARQEAMFRMRHETTLTFPQIGQRLGGRDHTTVIYGVRKHAERMEAAGQ